MKKAFQLFQADPEKVLQMQNLTDADFEKAAEYRDAIVAIENRIREY